MKTDSEKIAIIMNEFDFDKVHEAMVKMDWKWARGSNGKLQIPSIKDIKDEARRLMLRACDDNLVRTECGGLRVERDNDGFIELSFVLTDWSEWDEEDDPPQACFNSIEYLEV